MPFIKNMLVLYTNIIKSVLCSIILVPLLIITYISMAIAFLLDTIHAIVTKPCYSKRAPTSKLAGKYLIKLVNLTTNLLGSKKC